MLCQYCMYCTSGLDAGTAGSNSPGRDPEAPHTYMMDVIEEIGSDVAHRCYWDFGRWSDLCRVWRRAGDESVAEDLLDFEVSFYSTSACVLSVHAVGYKSSVSPFRRPT